MQPAPDPLPGTQAVVGGLAGMAAEGRHSGERGTNLLDGGAPFYGVYATADGAYVSVGALEPAFFATLCERVGVRVDLRGAQRDRDAWPALREEFARIFAARTRAEWTALLEGVDACFAPVLSLAEVAEHPHHRARGAFVTVGGERQPAPAPRFSRTPAEVRWPASSATADVGAVIETWGAGPARQRGM